MFDSILVTGGCGFIGTNLCQSFKSAGVRVTVLDNLSRAGAVRPGDRAHEIIEGDVRDTVAVGRAMDVRKP